MLMLPYMKKSFALLLLSLVAVFAEGATSFFSLQNFRPFRALRVLKIISVSPSLQVLVVMLAEAIKRAVCVMCLVFFIMFIFAVAGGLYFGEQATGDVEHWGGFGVSKLKKWSDINIKTDENFPRIIQQLRMSLSDSDHIVTKDKSSSLTFLQIYLTTLRHQDTTLEKLQQIYD
ncbi:hypothetical protein AOLI_G00106730 [Acnodon oligacanthus]